MKYLAFDIETAFDLNRISTDLFPPDDGEHVMIVKDIINEDSDEEEVWVKAKYIGNIIKRFRLPDGEVVRAKGTHWQYQGGDWERFRPLGITCAAAASSDRSWPTTGSARGTPGGRRRGGRCRAGGAPSRGTAA